MGEGLAPRRLRRAVIGGGVLLAAMMAAPSALAQAGAAPAGAAPAAAPPAGGGGGGRAVTPARAAAQAAGIRALHLCTGYFATSAPRAFIDDLASTSAQAIAPATARTEVDEQAKTVSVYYDGEATPRMAVARPVMGCTLLPIGADKTLAAALPRPAANISAPSLDDRPWPMGDRNATARLPAAKNAALQKVMDEAFKDEQGAYLGATWGVVVVQNGKIVAERYAKGFDLHKSARTNSMCKSLGAALVGVGVHKGLLDINRKGALSEWRRPGDPRGEITVNNLLHMASGLYSEIGGDRQNEVYMSGLSIADAGLGAMNSKPGARFVYTGMDNLLAVRALRQAVNDDTAYLTFPHRELLWKVGMTRTIVDADWNGDFVTSGQCWSTARDFGRFGMLYLADGVWNGERLLPEGWSKYAATPAPAQPTRPSIGGDAGYGAQFWLYGGLDGAPADTYGAFGARGQYMMLIPSQGLVVVRRGFDRQGAFRIAKFAGDVAQALN